MKWNFGSVGSLKLWNLETKKPRNGETKKLKNQETKKPRNQEIKQPGNFWTLKTSSNQENPLPLNIPPIYL